MEEKVFKGKEKPCYFYIDAEPLSSYREVTKKIMSRDIGEKEEALKTILGSMTNDDTYPQDLLITAIHNLTIVDDLRVKKPLLLFWEAVDKQAPNGKIKDEFILVCNSLRKDLEHPNEYVRGRTLRLLTKLPHAEILENLKAAVFENVSHSHPYVRSNALMCIISFISNFGEDVVPDTMPEKLKDIILKDTDIATKRNAYLVYSKVQPLESLKLTEEMLSNNEINELGDLFALAMVENLKNLCTALPQKKSKFIKLLLELSNHKSHSVLFEIGTNLLQVSSNPNTIRSAVNILCNLLVEQRDNNTLIIILKKLIEIKNKYREILEEQILSLVIILDLNCTAELRKLLFELISDLILHSNISQVFEIFISVFNKLKGVTETDSTIEFKNMILGFMHQNIRKVKNVNKAFPIFVLEKCLMYNSRGTFLHEQISIIKDLFVYFGMRRDAVVVQGMMEADNVNVSNYLQDFLNKIFANFEDINSYEILQTCIWILAEYSNDIQTLKKVFDIIMKNMGDLDFEYQESNNKLEDSSKPDVPEKKVITKTVILSDGTYGTQTITVDPQEPSQQKEVKWLRKFILESNYFFSTNLVVALTRIVVTMSRKDTSDRQEIFKTYYYNCCNIICAILKMNSEKIFKDPDNVSRISMCLEFLINNDFDSFLEWVQECKEIYETYIVQLPEKQDEMMKKNETRIAPADEFIGFRHTKLFDLDNFDVVEDHVAPSSEEKEKMNEMSFKDRNKFIEVLTGSEDPIHIEAVVEVFTFDIVIEFFVKNKTKSDLHGITIELYAQQSLDVIEKAPSITLAAGESKTVRSCIKFSQTCNSYIYGLLIYSNSKGALSYLNLSGIFIDLLNTYPADISENNFRKYWTEYNWEQTAILISKKRTFHEVIDCIIQKLNMKLVVPQDISQIEEDSAFLVCNLYTKSKLGEDSMVNISIEKSPDKKIIGTAYVRSRAKEFAQLLADKIQAIVQ